MPALDTLQFAEYLRKNGVPTAQADAIADGFNKQLEEHVLTHIATKQDLASALDKLEARLINRLTEQSASSSKEIANLEMRMTTKLFASQIGIAGLIVALMKFI
ncbi:MAG: hypothetical protein AAGJ73_13330 [Pseudomonadota bacterium]